MSRRLRVAIVADLLSEQWPSMDLVADMFYAHVKQRAPDTLDVELLRPKLRDRGRGIGRYVNRYWDYSRWLRPHAKSYDVFHIVDHSYAHLVHVLPADRTAVTLHDVDAFMPLVDPAAIPSSLPKAVTRRILSGLRKAARVTCDSAATFDEARKFDLLDSDRMTIVPVGVHPDISPHRNPDADRAVAALIGVPQPGIVDLLHVGSCIPRKRIDILLKVLSGVRRLDPRARLLKAGGSLTGEQIELARSLGVIDHILQLPFMDTAVLAALYRRAAAVLVTSEREGFGLPVVESLAAGTPVVASDIAVLREVGGDAVRFAPLDAVAHWVEAVRSIIAQAEQPRESEAARQRGLDIAARYQWSTSASTLASIYMSLCSSRA